MGKISIDDNQRQNDYDRGLNDYELAKLWHVERRAVQNWRRNKGLPCHPKQREVPKHYRTVGI
jgi:hypothetical protein